MKLEWRGCLRLVAALFGLYLLIYYWSSAAHLGWTAIQAAWPLMLGCVIAYVVNLPMSFLERHFPAGAPGWLRRIRRPICLVLALLCICLLVFLIARMIVPELISCVTLLLERLPEALNSISAELEKNFHISQWFSDEADGFFTGETDWQTIIQNAADWLASGFSGAMSSITGVVSSIVSKTVAAVVAAIFSVYILLDKEVLTRQFHRLLNVYGKKSWTEPLFVVIHTLDDCFHRFLVGQCLEAAILGMLCIIGMLIFQFPYAVMIGCLVGFTALIPIAGAYIGAIVGALMILTVSPLKALLFLVFLVVLQQLEGNLIYPRVVGGSIGLPGIWVLAAITVGGSLMGIGGMLLSVPLTAAIYRLVRRDVIRRSVPEGTAEQSERTQEGEAHDGKGTE